MTAVVADTHTIIWYLRESTRLSEAALASLNEAIQVGDPVYVSTISVVEVAYLVEKYRLPAAAFGQREQYKKDTQLPTFYNGRNRQYPKLKDTTIGNAITPISQDNELSIIITDLDPEGDDITNVSKEIQKNYLNSKQATKGYAVGVLAIKSEFNGIIYNEDMNNTGFHYNTYGKSIQKYHPFYALFLGKYSDVDYFFTKTLKEGGELVNKNTLVIFSPDYILEKSSHLDNKDNNELPRKINIRRPPALQYDKVAVKKNNGQSTDLLEIGKNEKQEIHLNYNVPLNTFDHTLLFDDNSLTTKVKIYGFNTFGKPIDKTSSLKPKKVLEINKFNLNYEQKKLSFITNINPSQMESGIYLFTVDAIATELQEQPWWGEWNSTEVNRNDGSKTLNILKFLQQMKDLTTDLMGQPIVGRFCYAIQKD